MASLLEIRNKIKATKSTKKITKAMQLVAASKMKSFQKTAGFVRAYTLGLLESLQLCGASLEETIYAKERGGGKVLFVLLTSDKGLCGAMNTKLIRRAFRSELWMATPPGDRLLITVGRKSAEAARIAGYEITESFSGLKEKLETVDALEVISSILELWKAEEVSRVVMISPEYVNPFVFHVRERDYLPLTPKTIQALLEIREDAAPKDSKAQDEAAFFEPDRESVVDRIAQQVVESLFIEAFFELKATEYSSRMVAMKKATEAADDKIRVLTNAFNKARQSVITQQLSELAAAGEAMSSENMYETFQV